MRASLRQTFYRARSKASKHSSLVPPVEPATQLCLPVCINCASPCEIVVAEWSSSAASEIRFGSCLTNDKLKNIKEFDKINK